MKKLFYFLIAFSLLTVSCSKDNDMDDDSIIYQGPNDNHLIAGAWVLSDLVVKEMVIDNQDAAKLILEQYQTRIGEIISFHEGGTYTTSGTFFEIVSKFKLKDNLLTFSKDYVYKVTFEGDTFSFESDYTSGFEWFLKEAASMDKYKNTKVTKVIIKEVYKRVKK